jgi:hypothetical protein
LSKKTPFFAEKFDKNNFKIITSVPGLRALLDEHGVVDEGHAARLVRQGRVLRRDPRVPVEVLNVVTEAGLGPIFMILDISDEKVFPQNCYHKLLKNSITFNAFQYIIENLLGFKAT